MSHIKKNTKKESHATQGSSSFTSHIYDEQLNNIMATLQEITTKISRLATIMHSQHIRFNTKFKSLQTQLDQIQRKLEEHEDKLFHDKKGEMVSLLGECSDRGSAVKGGGEDSNYYVVYCVYCFHLKL